MNNKVELVEGDLFVDDRGYLSFFNDFKFDDIKRFYVVENHEKGYIRAWHGHLKERKYAYVVSGSALICLVPLEDIEDVKNQNKKDPSLVRVVMTSHMPGILFIPEGYANGFKTLEENTKIIFFSSATLEESKNDDYRYKWNLINPWGVRYR